MLCIESLCTYSPLQVISDACSEKKAELRGLERNVTALSSTTQALHGWIKVNEAKVSALPAEVSPGDVIVPVDDLCVQSIAAQVRLPHPHACCRLHVCSAPHFWHRTTEKMKWSKIPFRR